MVQRKCGLLDLVGRERLDIRTLPKRRGGSEFRLGRSIHPTRNPPCHGEKDHVRRHSLAISLHPERRKRSTCGDVPPNMLLFDTRIGDGVAPTGQAKAWGPMSGSVLCRSAIRRTLHLAVDSSGVVLVGGLDGKTSKRFLVRSDQWIESVSSSTPDPSLGNLILPSQLQALANRRMTCPLRLRKNTGISGRTIVASLIRCCIARCALRDMPARYEAESSPAIRLPSTEDRPKNDRKSIEHRIGRAQWLERFDSVN